MSWHWVGAVVQEVMESHEASYHGHHATIQAQGRGDGAHTRGESTRT